ncbi:MAG: PQQ-binding-like beta-propeller repeat protein [Phycisphaerae bacterium]
MNKSRLRKIAGRLRSFRGSMVLVVAGLLSAGAGAGAADWTQWGGAGRDFMVDGGPSLSSWSDSGPAKIWERPLGDGYATIVAHGDLLFTQYRPGEKDVEYVIAMRAKDGKTVWEHETKSPYTETMKQFGPGPSSTPVVANGHVFAVGANMMLHAFAQETGKVVWSKNLVEEFGATVPGRGYCASPIAFGDTIIVPVGAGEGKSIIALKQKDGNVAWSKHDYQMAHASPILGDVAGTTQLVFATKAHMIGIDPNDGTLHWEQQLNPEGAYLASPILLPDDHIFISSAYGGGSHLIKVAKDKAKQKSSEVWYGRKLRIHHANAIFRDGHIYGSSGDFGPAFITCIEMATGEMKWRKRGFSKATLVQSGDKTVLLDEDGQLALATLTPDDMQVHCQTQVAELYAWAAPTLIDGKLYVRDRKNMVAFDLRAGN